MRKIVVYWLEFSEHNTNMDKLIIACCTTLIIIFIRQIEGNYYFKIEKWIWSKYSKQINIIIFSNPKINDKKCQNGFHLINYAIMIKLTFLTSENWYIVWIYAQNLFLKRQNALSMPARSKSY